MFLQRGKLGIIIDGQFGSTGKGLMASYLGYIEPVDIAISNASPNAGHTYYFNGQKHVTRHLPISGILNEDSKIYLCAGAIIDPEILEEELDMFNIDRDRLYIHPRAAIIETQDKELEKTGATLSIASTQKGVGSALMRKIGRSATLAQNSVLAKYARNLNLSGLLDSGYNALMETPQGLGLSINSGLSYPHCTSREITVAAAMADAQLHPHYLGNVVACIRTFPIRVGNIVQDGKIVGYSGPFYNDSKEVTWEEVGVPKEYTTNTKRIRRVASFSFKQYEEMLNILRPTHVFLNFANYLEPTDLNVMLSRMPEVTHLGFGPEIDDVVELRKNYLTN